MMLPKAGCSVLGQDFVKAWKCQGKGGSLPGEIAPFAQGRRSASWGQCS